MSSYKAKAWKIQIDKKLHCQIVAASENFSVSD